MVVRTSLFVMTLLIALTALGFAVLALRRTAETGAERTRSRQSSTDLPEDALGLRQEVAALRAENANALKHLALVRYDAFADLGGSLSWSVALLDDHGNGAVLTSIHGRNDARTYAKSVTGWTCAQPPSPEEDEAIASARPR